MTVEVCLLNYKFRFRRLTWLEELNLVIPPGKNSMRVVLAHALENVSDLKASPEEAEKIFAVMPLPVVSRVYRIYKGSLPTNRRFETAGLYCAPEPSAYAKRVLVEEEEVDDATERAMKNMENRFGRKELAEAAEVDRKILKASQLRGATKIPTPEPQNDKGLTRCPLPKPTPAAPVKTVPSPIRRRNIGKRPNVSR